jgi:hypothetical protein
MNTLETNILALLIIEKGDSFANSYNLCKTLSWKFKTINCHEIINDLISRDYITAEYTNGIGEFKLTNLGEKLIKENRNGTIKKLREAYPEELKIIDSFEKKGY